MKTNPVQCGLVVVLICLGLPLSVEGKVMSGAAKLDSMITELYIAKFAFSSYAHGVISVTSPLPALFLILGHNDSAFSRTDPQFWFYCDLIPYTAITG